MKIKVLKLSYVILHLLFLFFKNNLKWLKGEVTIL